MDIEIGLDETINDAANRYYSLSKKMKKKIEGVKKAIGDMEKKLKNIKFPEKLHIKEKRKKFWFEKYRFSFTRNGFLVIAGKDAYSNEAIVKKYLEKDDLHFHSDVHGAAHVILKNGQKASKEDIEDAALIAAIYSKALAYGLNNVDVYYVLPEQVSKTPESGEYLPTGAFVIRGKRNWIKNINLDFYLGVYNYENVNLLVLGNEKLFKNFKIHLKPGNIDKNTIAKVILKKLQEKNYDFIIEDLYHILPSGKLEIIN